MSEAGYIDDGGVVLVWCPRPKTMEKLHHLEKSVVVLVEWIPGEMAAGLGKTQRGLQHPDRRGHGGRILDDLERTLRSAEPPKRLLL